MTAASPDSRQELRAFRFRLRHDQLLRQRLRRAKQQATLALAQELGFALTLEDLQGRRAKGKQTKGNR